MCLMSTPSLPASPVSNVSFHSSRLPGDSFSVKSMLALVPVLRLQTLTCLLGAVHAYLCSSSSSPPLPLSVPLFKSSQASERLCLFPVFYYFFFQGETGGSKQPGSFSSSFYLLSCFLFAAALSIPFLLSISLVLQIEQREILDRSTVLREQSQLCCFFFF